MNAQQLIKQGKTLLENAGIQSAEYEAQQIIQSLRGVTAEEQFFALINQRATRQPLQHILGFTYFYGYQFNVNNQVFIPRFETEILVEKVLSYIQRQCDTAKRVIRILDLCTGSGTIAVTLAKECAVCTVIGIDISQEALLLARENAKNHGVQDRILFLCGDLFAPLNKYTFDIIVSNPPYIRTEDIKHLPPEVQHDPRISLDGDKDGLLFYKKIAQAYRSYLHPDGALFLEIGDDQAPAVKTIFQHIDPDLKYEVYQDLNGRDRVMVRC